MDNEPKPAPDAETWPEEPSPETDPFAPHPTEHIRTGGLTSLMPEDADYAVEVCREQDPIVSCNVPLRLEPQHYIAPYRPRPTGKKR